MVGGKWSDLGHILKRESVSFADRLFVGYKRRRTKDNFKDFCQRNGKNQGSFPEIGTRQVTLILKRRSGVAAGGEDEVLEERAENSPLPDFLKSLPWVIYL